MRKSHSLALAVLSLGSALAAEPAVTRNFWDFESESSRFLDRVGGVNGTVTAATTVLIGDGHHTGGAAMNAVATIASSNDYVAVNGTSSGFHQPGMGAFSVSLWFRMPVATGADRGIFDFSGDTVTDGPQMLLTAANSLNFRVDGSGSYNLVAALPGSTVEDGQWHFVAAVYDPALTTGTLKVYLDGSTVTSSASRGATAATAIVSPEKCWLGTFNVGTTAQVKGLNGDLDDLAYYSGALTEQQIGQLHAGTLQPGDLAPPAGITLTSYGRADVTGESTLKWLSVDGTEYTVWGSTDLSEWTEVTVSPVEGTGSEVEFSHTPPGSPSAYFYQVRDN